MDLLINEHTTNLKPVCLNCVRGEGGTPCNGLYGEAPNQKGTLSRLEVYERVGISVVRVAAGGQDKKSWLVIGGERGKSRPSWIGVFCDWSRAREREAIFAQIRELSIKLTSPETEVKMSKCVY